VAEQWFGREPKVQDLPELVHHSLTETATVGANQIFEKLQEFSRELSRGLTSAAGALGANNVPNEEELTGVVREMPRFDLGPLAIELRRDPLAVLGRGMTERRVRNKLSAQIGPAVDEAFQRYGRMLELWIRRTLSELQRRFDSHADAYRAQLERLTATKEASTEHVEAVRQDLAALSAPRLEKVV
jgi:hypothetical protein